ncbi:hypothetical protein BC938DRAFT_480855 [Jimgerdemannia flammicorona]|uniref:Guanine nucleotide binding protein, alpha subunit n=1 Tax=Jimgerdemannia flammicorona TaxID=994334 RepID=A0A433QI92_9FUNG|nr:hypothetical protein BC938DRAFT_480855 [Jimgerdemannia flammicorona]
MGNCVSSNSNNPSDKVNKDIDRRIKSDEKKLKTEVKLLLLASLQQSLLFGNSVSHCNLHPHLPQLTGAGESGKSTILKQMRLIHAAGFSAAERESFRIVVFSNVMQSMQTILEAMEYLRIPLLENINMSGYTVQNSATQLWRRGIIPIDNLDGLRHTTPGQRHHRHNEEIKKSKHPKSLFREIIMSTFHVCPAMPLSNVFCLPQAYIPLFSEYPTITKGKPYPDSYLKPLRSLWSDDGVQEAYKRGNTFALNDNVKYFFDRLDRLFASDYIPTDQDIIRCRVKTTGIVETVFHLGPLTYRMFDVGGQRSERKKWIHCFENVTALLFVVAISGYDQCLVEDKDANQMHEALMLFDSICNSQWFINTSMILFLNKIDIFKLKIAVSPVSKYFPDYKEGPDDDFNQTKAYFRRRFIRLNRSEKKEVYPHFTDATDTNLLRHVMTAVSDIILNENLQLLLL